MYVAIIKTVSDLLDKSEYVGLPDTYPVECKEIPTLQQAQSLYPNATIMTVSEYKVYSATCRELYLSVQPGE